MTQILVWLGIAGLLLIAFVITLFLAIVRKNKKLAVISLIPFVCAMFCAAVSMYYFVSKSYNVISRKIERPFKSRTGEKIYADLFGRTSRNCLDVINYKDQSVPGLDCCIWLEIKSCPEEVKRIVMQSEYEMILADSLHLKFNQPNSSEQPVWWTPAALGDSAIIFKYQDKKEDRVQILFVSLDSTRAYYFDAIY
jgi:hypothetical protein